MEPCSKSLDWFGLIVKFWSDSGLVQNRVSAYFSVKVPVSD